MDWRARMLAGQLYRAGVPGLTEERRRARRLTRLYNATTEDEGERREALLRELFGSLGSGAEIEPPFHVDYGCHIHAGDGLYINFGGVILDCAEVRLGNGVLMAPYVQINAAYHPTDPEVRMSGLELAAPVTIGDNVWIGGGAIVCPGVTIGEHTTIGAGSVVVRDIPAGVVAAGVPCRVLRDARAGDRPR